MTRLAHARAALAAAEERAGVTSGDYGHPLTGIWPSLIPAQRLRGGVVQISARYLLWPVMAQMMGAQGWAAVLGMDDIGWQAAIDAGVDVQRVITVPGPANAAVIAAAVDGLAVVVVGENTRLNAADRRALGGRIRSRGTCFLTTAGWSGAYRVAARTDTALGCDDGAGWIDSLVVDTAAGRLQAEPAQLQAYRVLAAV